MSKTYTMDCLIENYFKRSKILLQKGETAEFISGDSNWSVKVEVNELKQDKETLGTVCRISTKSGFCNPKPRVLCYRYTRGIHLQLKDMKFQEPLLEWTTLLVTDQFQQFMEDNPHREDLRLMFELYLGTNDTSESEMFPNMATAVGGHLMNPTYSDVTIRTSEGDELPAHKILLVARSGVFRALFQHDTAEKATNIVECPFTTKLVKHLLVFIYQDKVADIEETAFDLLVAADYYHLNPLKKLCEDVLKNKLNDNYAIALLKLADTSNACNLKKEALEFIKIKNNAVEIVKRKDWESLSKELVQSIFKFTVSD